MHLTNASTTIGVVVPMASEMAVIKDVFGVSLQALSNEKFLTYLCQMPKFDIFFVVSGIGKVNATIATAHLFEKFTIDLVLNIGIAGAVNASMQFGDVFVATHALYHDVDATIFNYAWGQVPGMVPVFPTVWLPEIMSHPILNIKNGALATGDSFISDSSKLAGILAENPNVMAVDMEGTAVAQAADSFGIPCICVKGISDIIGAESAQASQQYLPLATRNAVTFMQDSLLSQEASALFMSFKK